MGVLELLIDVHGLVRDVLELITDVEGPARGSYGAPGACATILQSCAKADHGCAGPFMCVMDLVKGVVEPVMDVR